MAMNPFDTSYGSYIRVNSVRIGLDTSRLNSMIRSMLNAKTKSINTDLTLKKYVGHKWLEVVTPLIPFKTGKLANSGQVTTEGRVWWSAYSKNGYNYAMIQYEMPSSVFPKLRARPRRNNSSVGVNGRRPVTSYYHPIRYPGHEPTDHWADKCAPGTYRYDGFVKGLKSDAYFKSAIRRLIK